MFKHWMIIYTRGLNRYQLSIQDMMVRDAFALISGTCIIQSRGLNDLIRSTLLPIMSQLSCKHFFHLRKKRFYRNVDA